MEEAYKDGKVRAIVVSNFYPDRFIDIATFCEVVPAVNQIETHLFQQQKTAKSVMQKYGTQIESRGPFAEDMEKLEALDTAHGLFFSHYDPQTVAWFMSVAK